MSNPYNFIKEVNQLKSPFLQNQYQQQVIQPQVYQGISIGKFKDKSTKFDDKFVLTAQVPPFKLSSIMVHFNDYIVGIAFKYKCGDGYEHWCRHNLCTNTASKIYFNVTEKEFTIDDDDYLLEINGKSGDWLDRIGFVTYNGKNQNFGGKGGEPFTHKYYGSTFGIVGGAFAEYIEGLYFQVLPLQDHIIQRFQHLTSQKSQQVQIVLPQISQQYVQPSQFPSNYQNPSQQPSQFPQPIQSQIPFPGQYPQPLQQPQMAPIQNNSNYQYSQPISNQSQQPNQQQYQQPQNLNYDYPPL